MEYPVICGLQDIQYLFLDLLQLVLHLDDENLDVRLVGLRSHRVDLAAQQIIKKKNHGVLHQEDLFVAGVQQRADLHDEHQDDGAADGGQRDVPHQLPAAGAVDLGGFIQLGIDAGEGREVDDRAVTGLFPEVLTDDHRREELGIGHDVGGVLFAEHLDQHMIGDTVGGGEELIGQRRHNHDGDEVRDIHQRLGKALEPFAAQLVEQQCEDDRRREGEDQVGQRDCQRVAQQTPEIRAGEEFFKVLQSGEGAAEQRLDGGVAIVGAEVLDSPFISGIYFMSCTVIWTVQLFMCEECENWGDGIEIILLL